MTTLTIRNVDDDLRARLRVRAARNGRSMEAEVRAILRSALSESVSQRGLGTSIHELFADIGGADLPQPPRTDMPRAAEFPE
jgi:plasmid stability protein